MTERELEQSAARLGDAEVRSIDTERIVERVLARLAAEPGAEVRPVRRRLKPWLIGLAAAAAVLITVRFTVLAPTTRPPDRLTALSSVLPELDGLGAGELEEILEAIPAPAGELVPNPETVPWTDLDSGSLERLLRSLEG
ncbi:MAG: hypothetical protein ACT4PM_00045 [Gemmatimonadales bacterium]